MPRTKIVPGKKARRLYKYNSRVTKKLYKDNKRNQKKGRAGRPISRKILTRVYGEQVGEGFREFFKYLFNKNPNYKKR